MKKAFRMKGFLLATKEGEKLLIFFKDGEIEAFGGFWIPDGNMDTALTIFWEVLANVGWKAG